MRFRIPLFLLCALFMLLSGCGKKLVPVEGVVVFEGEPLPGANLTFMPDLEDDPTRIPRISHGFTDGEGRFRMETDSDGGVLPGKYKVTVAKTIRVDIVRTTPDPKNPLNLPNVTPFKSKRLVPKIYGDLRTTPLSLVVPKGGSKDLQLIVESK